MALMAHWARVNSGIAFALPTLATVLSDCNLIVPQGVELLDPSEIGGVVDAAQIGQWIAGIDPRNVPINEKPMTRFIDEPTPGILTVRNLESIKFSVSPSQQELRVITKTSEFCVYNLHIHSKCHESIFRQNPSLKTLIEKSNNGLAFRIPGMRSVQLRSYFSKAITALRKNPKRLRMELERRAKFKLNIRASSSLFISGDTFRLLADHKWESGSKELRATDLRSGDIVFCESELLSHLDKEVLSKSDKPITLILGNSDQNHTERYVQELKLSILGDVFAQNLMDKIEGFHPLPIGIENAWRSNHGMIRLKKVKSAGRDFRINRIMWGFNSATNPIIRGKASRELRLLPTADQIENVGVNQHQELLAKYSFVASPPGNGIDTHRTWEAMYFKCVPIVLKSYMTTYYEEIGLPVWVLDSYEELSSETEASLAEIYAHFSDKFDSRAIWYEYWSNLIKSSSLNLRSKN